MRKQAGDVAAAGDLANQQIATVGKTLDERLAALEKAAGVADGALKGFAERLADKAGALESASETAREKTEATAALFDDKAERLTRAADAAADQAKQLAQRDMEARRNLFLKTARFIVEDLNSISIDLTRMLQGEVPEADWKRYVKGDRGVFTRTLLRQKQGAAVRRIAEKVQQDPEARKYVTRYVDQFERLLAESESADPEHLLHSTFMTADVGKLHILLNRALGREE